MKAGKSATLVIHKEDVIKCIYEVEGSNQKFFPQHGEFKVPVTIYPITDADIKRNLKIAGLTENNKLNKKGFLFILPAIKSADIDEKNIKSSLVKLGYITTDNSLTKEGLIFLKTRMADELTGLKDGDLALDECSKNEKLVKFIK